jgi:hypothetical protein
MTTVREFSPAGPCIVLGELVGESSQFYTYRDRFIGTGLLRRIAKRTPARWSRAHIEPCPSCRDHAKTQYPNGYMD